MLFSMRTGSELHQPFTFGPWQRYHGSNQRLSTQVAPRAIPRLEAQLSPPGNWTSFCLTWPYWIVVGRKLPPVIPFLSETTPHCPKWNKNEAECWAEWHFNGKVVYIVRNDKISKVWLWNLSSEIVMEFCFLSLRLPPSGDPDIIFYKMMPWAGGPARTLPAKRYREPAARLEHYLQNDTVSRRPG